MGSEMNPPSSSSSSTTPASTSTSTPATTSPGTKRSRDPEDEVYIDNLHSHKRYLSEIMASSLNGLTVEDPLPENLMYSPARDDMNLQYSPMSEDSDDCRYYESPTYTCSSQPDSRPTSPVSPYRYQRFPSVFSSSSPTTSFPFHGCSTPAATSSQPRQRGSDSEGRFPSSPSDICHSADLRRAALLRSVQMRTHPLGPTAFELSFSAGQEPGGHNMEAEERPCSYLKSLVDEREYQIEEVCKSLSILGPENREKSCRALNLKLKGDDSAD
ncbi:hypothetical protein LguiB_000077 [Lonicera macranthoides]